MVVVSESGTAQQDSQGYDLASDYAFAIRTAEGALVAVDGDFPAKVTSGSEFAGTVSVPDAVLDQLPAAVADTLTNASEPLEASSDAALEIQQTAVDSGAPLELAHAQVTLAEATALTGGSHQAFVAVPRPVSGNPTNWYSGPQALDLASSVASYWVDQANGTMTQFSVSSNVQRYASTLDCAADPIQFWNEAAAHFGKTPAYYLATLGEHLVVMLPEYCDGIAPLGIASIGSSVISGGVSLVTTGVEVDRPVLAHEVGHNLGLQHANLDYCSSDVAVRCDEIEYADLYDIMGSSIEFEQVLTTLNGRSLVQLGFTTGNALSRVTLPAGQLSTTVTVTLGALDLQDPSRPYVVQVTDPVNGQDLFLDYRSGVNADRGSFYSNGGSSRLEGSPTRTVQYARGVRAIRTTADGGSSIITIPGANSVSTVLQQGKPFVSPASGVSITTGRLTGSTVDLTITLTLAAPVYRFWSQVNRSHFYTISQAERDLVIDQYDDSVWKYEGVAYLAYQGQQAGTVPVYRFWSERYRGHFYTVSEDEKNQVIANYPDEEWLYEQVAFYVYPGNSAVVGGRVVYRFWSEQNKHHFYTASAAERDQVIAQYSDFEWLYEGPQFVTPPAEAMR